MSNISYAQNARLSDDLERELLREAASRHGGAIALSQSLGAILRFVGRGLKGFFNGMVALSEAYYEAREEAAKAVASRRSPNSGLW